MARRPRASAAVLNCKTCTRRGVAVCTAVTAGLGALLVLTSLLTGCRGSSSSKPSNPASAGVVVSTPHIEMIPGAVFDASSADRIARTARYGAWVRLRDEHVLDLAVWPSVQAAQNAAKRYAAGGRATRPRLHNPAWPRVVRRLERVRNVTLAWYTEPTKADQSGVRRALRFHVGQRRTGAYTGIWAISGATIDPDFARAGTTFEETVALTGGCRGGTCGHEGGGCVPLNAAEWDIEIGLWSSAAAAKTYVDEVRDVLDPGERLERVSNATIDWRCRATDADEVVIRAALH
jgi:hypothetical protein